MKSKLKLLAILFVTSIFFISCSKEPQIIGKWKLSKIAFENQMIAALMTNFSQQIVGQVVEFRTDGTMTADVFENDTVSSNEYEGSLRYTLDGNNITLTLDEDALPSDTSILEIIQQYDDFAMTGTFELPDKNKLKMSLGLPFPENELNMREIKFTIEADRQ
jgi:hypothetical protein